MGNYSEAALGLQWLYGILSSDSTLSGLAPGGVWRSYAPPESQVPYVIISFHSGNDVTTLNAYRIMDDLLYQAKAIGPAMDTATITQAAARIDKLLGGPPGLPTSGTIMQGPTQIGQVLACFRTAPIQVDELVNGEPWTNIGGMYRLLLEQIAS